MESKFDWTVFFYPNILNPLDWILVVYFMPKLIFTSWWKYEEENHHILLSLDYKSFKKMLKNYLFFFIMMLINTFWYNNDLSVAYVDYLSAKWFSKYPKRSVDYYVSVQSAYEKYFQLKKKDKNRNKTW